MGDEPIYRLIDLVRRLDRDKSTLIRWEAEGKISKAKRDTHGWRYYTPDDFDFIVRTVEADVSLYKGVSPIAAPAIEQPSAGAEDSHAVLASVSLPTVKPSPAEEKILVAAKTALFPARQRMTLRDIMPAFDIVRALRFATIPVVVLTIIFAGRYVLRSVPSVEDIGERAATVGSEAVAASHAAVAAFGEITETVVALGADVPVPQVHIPSPRVAFDAIEQDIEQAGDSLATFTGSLAHVVFRFGGFFVATFFRLGNGFHSVFAGIRFPDVSFVATAFDRGAYRFVTRVGGFVEFSVATASARATDVATVVAAKIVHGLDALLATLADGMRVASRVAIAADGILGAAGEGVFALADIFGDSFRDNIGVVSDAVAGTRGAFALLIGDGFRDAVRNGAHSVVAAGGRGGGGGGGAVGGGGLPRGGGVFVP